MNNLKGKEIEQLMELICQLGPVEFAGLATMMKIPLVEEDEQKTPRSFVEVFEDVLKKFAEALSEVSEIESKPKFEFKSIYMVLAPKK